MLPRRASVGHAGASRFAWQPPLSSAGAEPVRSAQLTADEKPITPGERLLYALGQLAALWKRGELPVPPAAFDADDVARIIGVSQDIEFVRLHETRLAGPEIDRSLLRR